MQNTLNPGKWSLSDLFADPIEEAVEETFSKLEELTSKIEKMRETLTNTISVEDFLQLIQLLEEHSLQAGRLDAYAELWLSEDSQNPDALDLRDRVAQELTDAGNRILFFDLWFKELPDDVAQKLIASSGDLQHYFKLIRQLKPYTLSEPQEQMINIKDVNGIDAMVDLYDLIVNKFIFTLEVDGEKKELTNDQIVGYVRHPSPSVREAAYKELYRVYGENSSVLSQIYLHRVRDWNAEAIELRGFASPISVRNIDNDLPDAVVDTLLDVCRKNTGIFQRYFELKAKWVGLPSGKLRRYDLYAPLVKSDKKFDYRFAVQTTLESFRNFSPRVADLVQSVFDANHVDSESRPGKDGGAFCYSAVPGIKPWVLINYENRIYDITSLAHEMGHAVHNMLAGDHSILNYRSSLALAETASIFAEMLLTDNLLKLENDPATRRDLLASIIDDAYATIIRQAYFSIFEREAYHIVSEGGSVEELTEAYFENIKEQFGNSVELFDDFKREWTLIPHLYHTPFYTYAYSFGQLLVLALYQQYRTEGESFVPRYLKILSYGGSEAPMKILSEAGLDITTPEFWQGGFDFINSLIADLEGLSVKETLS